MMKIVLTHTERELLEMLLHSELDRLDLDMASSTVSRDPSLTGLFSHKRSSVIELRNRLTQTPTV